MDRKAKIVCTIGPASSSKDIVFRLIKGGMDVARLNFSHGTHASHREAVKLIREGSRLYKRPVGVLQDLQGIKIRIGPVKGGAVTLKKGRTTLISAGEGISDSEQIFISYPGIIRDAKPGNRILLDDGLMELRVIGKTKNSLWTKVMESGTLTDRKGVNLPGMKITMPSFTDKDRADLEFGLWAGVDYVAVSFVRTAADLRTVKDYLINTGRTPPPIIAKIEKPEALENIDEIMEEADGLMVARGDLGVEVPPEEVPLIQKMLIERANRRGRIIITATQMLESMTGHMRPTRAEATDVANAVIDGSDALMLSAETSSGKYPLRALGMMDRIIRKTEGGAAPCEKVSQRPITSGTSFSEAVADAASRAAEDIGAKFIAAFTQSGFTARLISKFRPLTPVVAFTPSEGVRRKMSLYWGVTPMIMRPLKSTDSVFREVEKTLLKESMARPGDGVVITASAPILGAGRTNFLKLHRVTDPFKHKPAAK